MDGRFTRVHIEVYHRSYNSCLLHFAFLSSQPSILSWWIYSLEVRVRLRLRVTSLVVFYRSSLLLLCSPLISVIGWNWFLTMSTVFSDGGGLGAELATKRYWMQWRLRRLAETRESEGPPKTASSRHSILPILRKNLALHR